MGTRIREIREARKMSQEELARATGLPKKTISLLEEGKVKTLGAKTVLSIANALGVVVNELIYPEGSWVDAVEGEENPAAIVP